MTKIGALIPTRGDRGPLLNFALRQLERQTKRVDHIEIVNDAPKSASQKDITWRYRVGLERMFAKGVETVFLIEDDDWYADNYIEKMLEQWTYLGQPEVFGLGDTYYYHLGLRGYNQHLHSGRASAFCTLITKAGAEKMRWPADTYAFTDIEIWKQLQGKTFLMARPIAIGMKGHQNGTLFGGMGHSNNKKLYTNRDENMEWLKRHVDEESFTFYSNIANIVGNKISLQ